MPIQLLPQIPGTISTLLGTMLLMPTTEIREDNLGPVHEHQSMVHAGRR